MIRYGGVFDRKYRHLYRHRMSSNTVRYRFSNRPESQIKPFSIRIEKLPPEFVILHSPPEASRGSVLNQVTPEDDGVKQISTGPVLGIHYSERQQILIVVCENKVLFFRHYPTVEMFQKMLSGAKKAWHLVDEVRRLTRDHLVDGLFFDKKVWDLEQRIIYAEMRAQTLQKDMARIADSSHVYLNLYFLDRIDSELEAVVKSVQLDTVIA